MTCPRTTILCSALVLVALITPLGAAPAPSIPANAPTPESLRWVVEQCAERGGFWVTGTNATTQIKVTIKCTASVETEELPFPTPNPATMRQSF